MIPQFGLGVSILLDANGANTTAGQPNVSYSVSAKYAPKVKKVP